MVMEPVMKEKDIICMDKPEIWPFEYGVSLCHYGVGEVYRGALSRTLRAWMKQGKHSDTGVHVGSHYMYLSYHATICASTGSKLARQVVAALLCKGIPSESSTKSVESV